MFTLQQVENAIEAKYGFYDDEFYEALWDGRDVKLHGLGEVHRVDEAKETDTDSYGYETGSVMLVFKVGEQTFRKNGFINSYGHPDFDGRLFEVEEKEEVITKRVWKPLG